MSWYRWGSLYALPLQTVWFSDPPSSARVAGYRQGINSFAIDGFCANCGVVRCWRHLFDMRSVNPFMPVNIDHHENRWNWNMWYFYHCHAGKWKWFWLVTKTFREKWKKPALRKRNEGHTGRHQRCENATTGTSGRQMVHSIAIPNSFFLLRNVHKLSWNVT